MTEAEITKLVSEVHSGDADAMEAFAKLKTFADRVSAAADEVKPIALDEAINGYGIEQDKVSHKGFVFSYVKPRSQYNFKGIESWVRLEKEKKRIEELSKVAAKNGVEIADEETGEIIPPCIITYTKEGLSVKTAK